MRRRLCIFSTTSPIRSTRGALYRCWKRQRCRYELRHVDMAKGAHLSADYLAINPNHQVPTLVDGDLVLHESNAILRYLCHKHGLTEWYPADPKHRARVEQWLDWNQSRLSPAVIDIVFNSLFRRRAQGRAGDRPRRGEAARVRADSRRWVRRAGLSQPQRSRLSRTYRLPPTCSSSAWRRSVLRARMPLPGTVRRRARSMPSGNRCRGLDEL